jgi:hypothetical protein
MATTTFAVRQFYAIPNDYTGSGAEAPEGTFLITGSASKLLVNNNRTDLDLSGAGHPYPEAPANPERYGWFAGPNTSDQFDIDVSGWGTIVGGNVNYENLRAGETETPGGYAYVSCWGFQGTAINQGEYDTAFISLCESIFNTTFANTASAKTACRNAGYYYQWPVGLDGQSPNTGTGSDILT